MHPGCTHIILVRCAHVSHHQLKAYQERPAREAQMGTQQAAEASRGHHTHHGRRSPTSPRSDHVAGSLVRHHAPAGQAPTTPRSEAWTAAAGSPASRNVPFGGGTSDPAGRRRTWERTCDPVGASLRSRWDLARRRHFAVGTASLCKKTRRRTP